ncbi:TIM barrel protein [Caballeronia sp. LZ034LL]|uniref:hydroxypyruvate isomerase family protein n=1 Tax=Caballeronia sp. LZ034LL TaxID=3038567 RepID=UPI002864648E|nr:TIM barrel protein [Caballeronia sp. LZ034LL]MDR5836272.1 TIM barrel protein [Caballeronia sp. LZ034LL]
MKRRFAANLKWLFTELPLMERFEAAARQGFEAVEYASPYEYDPTELRRELDRWNLTHLLINTPAAQPGTAGANGHACLPGHVDTFREGIDQALDYASALGCGLIHLLAGKRPDACPQEEAEAVFRDNLAWAAERASGKNVTFVLECLNQQDVPGYFLRSLDHASTFLQRNVRLLFDCYHAGMSGVDVAREFTAHQEAIAHIQIADPPGRHEPGSGRLPWHAILRAIDDSAYAGWIGCEYRPRTTTLAGLDWRNDFPATAR